MWMPKLISKAAVATAIARLPNTRRHGSGSRGAAPAKKRSTMDEAYFTTPP
jgi:hypothetical protein